MPRDSKEGPSAAPSVTLRGRQLEVVSAVAREMGVELTEAVRAIIERWITCEEGMKVLLEAYGIDVRGREAKVLRMKADRDR